MRYKVGTRRMEDLGEEIILTTLTFTAQEIKSSRSELLSKCRTLLEETANELPFFVDFDYRYHVTESEYFQDFLGESSHESSSIEFFVRVSCCEFAYGKDGVDGHFEFRKSSFDIIANAGVSLKNHLK